MTSLLLLAAAATAEPSLPERFGLDAKYVFMQVISFLIVLGVLYKFGIKPVTASMEARTRKIEAGVKDAEAMQVKLAAAQQESAAIVRKANGEANKIVEDARKVAKDYLDRQTQEATAKANDLLAKAQQAMELEHKRMLADARHEIARLVVLTTEQVLARKLTDADRRAYNETAAQELTKV
jgi:F-type H+-transporting ATPase subunit b